MSHLKYIADRGYKGPSGNELVGYRWIWTWGERETRDDVKEVKVSDWDHASQCAKCDRNIVHEYWVKTPSGVEPYGSECVHHALGLSKPITEGKLRAMVAEAQTRLEYKQKEVERLAEVSKGILTVEEANKNFSSRHRDLQARGLMAPDQTVLMKHPDGRYYRTANPEQAGYLQDMGFNVVYQGSRIQLPKREVVVMAQSQSRLEPKPRSSRAGTVRR